MTANKQRPLNLRLRSAVISWTAGGLNWVNANITTRRAKTCWVDHLRWWIEGKLLSIFNRAFSGSDEELQAVYQSEIPVREMTDRQREITRQLHSNHPAHCLACGWRGEWMDCPFVEDCPACGHQIYLDAFEPEERGT